MSPALALSERIRDRIVGATGAAERHSEVGGPFLEAGDPDSTVGVMRVFDGQPTSPLDQIVWTKLHVPTRGVTTCMIFAFTRPDSPIPHFTLDCSDHGNGGHAFHLDLAPRVELATHLDYMDACFEPLTPVFTQASTIEGLSGTSTTRRQFAMMSPWMLVHLATADAFASIGGVVDGYVDHWLTLVDSGLDEGVVSGIGDVDLARRDAQFRTNLFNPSVDPVWGRVDAMIGAEAATTMRSTLQGDHLSR